jgi:uncharacterized protein YabN with tetrapyrrole methylase and pyrophosphatase domain
MLSIVGVGYNVAGHVTPEALSLIDQADRLLYLVTDPATAAWLRSRHPDAASLHDCYREDESGLDASNAMVERILEPLADGLDVCAAFSGHPAIGMHTTHEAIRRARELGVPARMLPAISFEDCLVADAGVDPGGTGRMMYEATDFVTRPRPLDPGAALVLLQVGAVGERDYRPGAAHSAGGLRLLQEVLERHYPAEHEVLLYERSPLPIAESSIVRLPLSELKEGPVGVATTLYAPPLERAPKDPAVMERLGLPPSSGAP